MSIIGSCLFIILLHKHLKPVVNCVLLFTTNKILPPMIQKYWSIIEVLHEITRMLDSTQSLKLKHETVVFVAKKYRHF